MYGKDYHYAATRLQGTVVRRGKHPVYIHDVERDGTVHAHTIITKKERVFPFKELNLATPELGMLNHSGKLSYLGRIPKRNDWRQGLRRNNVGVLWGARIDVTDRVLYSSIRGRYPTLDEAISDTIEEGSKIAIHRHWAICQDNKGKRINLFYKWYGLAGSMNKECKDVKLVSSEAFQFEHLKQALEEVLDGL